MKAILISIGIAAVLAAGLEILSRVAHCRWRKRFDSMPPDVQRKEQERLYKAHQ